MPMSPMLRAPFLGLGALSLMAFSAMAAERLHHDLDVILDPEAAALEVVDRIEVSGHDALAIKLAKGLTLVKASLNGEEMSPAREGDVLWIELPSEATSQVVLSYGGSLEADGGRRGLSPIMGKDGYFLPYGLGWLANAGAEDDDVTYELRVTVPAPYQAVATGALIEESAEDDAYRAVFAAADPTEPPSLFAGQFEIDERDHRGIRLRTYFPADQQQLAETYLDQAATYIDLYDGQIGAYPYDGFSMIAAPLPVGLGFPGLTYISAQILRMPFMQTRSLAHEILHNWWANGVFVDYSEGNWAEGLTTFMADYALAEAEGPDKALEMRLGWLRDFAALPAERDQPLTAFRSKGHDADQVIGYNKVAMVLHMLKQEIGEAEFEKGLKAFWTKHQFKRAAWSDIQTSFEAASGRDLSSFFAPWLQQKGAPRLSLDHASIKETDQGFELDLKLSGEPADYNLLVPVLIETVTGSENVTLRLQDGSGAATFATESKPVSVSIDRQHDLFRHLAPGEAPPILRDVTLNQQALTVIATNGDQGADEIAKELAARTLDTEVRLADVTDAEVGEVPLMLIGLVEEVAPVLSKIGLDPLPDALKDKGTARSWIAKRENAPPVLVVEARDDDALAALLRPLPHYSRNSYLVFEGRKMVEKGTWPSGDNALTQHFD